MTEHCSNIYSCGIKMGKGITPWLFICVVPAIVLLRRSPSRKSARSATSLVCCVQPNRAENCACLLCGRRGEAEILAYRAAVDADYADKSFLKRVDGLSSYALSDDEYHIALMLLFYSKSESTEHIVHYLGHLLPAKRLCMEDRTAMAMAWSLYMSAKNHLTSQVSQERRLAGEADAAKAAAKTPPDSATHILLRFRQSEYDTKLKKPRNLGNIRRVNLKKVVMEPSDEYLRFLTEWYNSMV